MSEKTYIPEGEQPAESQIGTSLEVLAGTISARRNAGEKSYTYRLLTGDLDQPLKKLMEEAGEVALAAKDADTAVYFARESADVAPGTTATERLAQAADDSVDHLRYEAGDVLYHLLVVLERFGISIDELAAEMNSRMSEDEISLHEGMVRLKPEHIKRGK